MSLLKIVRWWNEVEDSGRRQNDTFIKGHVMRTISLEELLESGAHFGHQVTRQNPKAREYVFEARDGIHIIDLAKTKQGLDEAAAFVKQLASKPDAGMIILGAKRQAQGIVREEAERAKKEGAEHLYSVTNRWIGGILTNFAEISKNFKRLNQLTADLQDKEKQAGYTKKEISQWDKERQKLIMFYGGIADMTKLPDAVFIIDTHLERLAVDEARDMRIPVVGITDTNADPTIVNYPIPANDDAVGSVQLIVHHIVDAWIEGCKLAKNTKEETTQEKHEAVNDTKDAKPELKTKITPKAKQKKSAKSEK